MEKKHCTVEEKRRFTSCDLRGQIQRLALSADRRILCTRNLVLNEIIRPIRNPETGSLAFLCSPQSHVGSLNWHSDISLWEPPALHCQEFMWKVLVSLGLNAVTWIFHPDKNRLFLEGGGTDSFPFGRLSLSFTNPWWLNHIWNLTPQFIFITKRCVMS